MSEIGTQAASIHFAGVSKVYPGSVTAVDDISLHIEAGTLVTLLGPSGCGKTTTLRLIAGLEMASAGRIAIGDEDVTLVPATERDVSMVFQSYALFPHMTVAENVGYGLRFSGHPKADIPARVAAGLDLVGLADYTARLPSELSGGQQQRVAVARALVLEPRVLLFDEPLSNLDAKLRRRVREEIREIQGKLGLTVVYVTHDQEEALAVSDRIIVMSQAVIAQDGTPRQLYEAPESAFVADFIGEANVLDCEVIAVEGARARVQLGPLVLDLPSRGRAAGPARLTVRPDRVGLGSGEGVPGRVRRSTYVGRHMEVTLESEIGEIFVLLADADAAPDVGDEVAISFPDGGPVLLPG